MKFIEFKNSTEYRKDVDSYCKHCLVAFKDQDELGRCEQTNHLTHTTCTKHSP